MILILNEIPQEGDKMLYFQILDFTDFLNPVYFSCWCDNTSYLVYAKTKMLQ